MHNTSRLPVLPLLLVAIAMSSTATGANNRVITLFDGETLDGWVTESGEPVTKGWEIQDGALTRTGGGGSIYVDREFGDFDLRFRWKIATNGNSGVKYRVRHYDQGVRGNPGWLGLEYQLWDDVAHESAAGDISSAGAMYALFGPSGNKHLNPAGEYNDSRIVVRGTRIEHWLNGQLIVQVNTCCPLWRERVDASKFESAEGFGENARGRIQLQDHGDPVWFRDITIRPLDEDNSPTRALRIRDKLRRILRIGRR